MCDSSHHSNREGTNRTGKAGNSPLLRLLQERIYEKCLPYFFSSRLESVPYVVNHLKSPYTSQDVIEFEIVSSSLLDSLDKSRTVLRKQILYRPCSKDGLELAIR